jgi:transcriptional regulator with XRE-family HTH domain
MSNPVKKLRESLGLNQVAFGELIGRSFQSVRNYEAGLPLSAEIIEKLKTVAVKRGRPDLAMELSSTEWQVKRVLEPGETLISQGKKTLPPGVRDFGTELHSVLDDILQSGNPVAIEATESTLRLFASCARRHGISADLPRRRRG